MPEDHASSAGWILADNPAPSFGPDDDPVLKIIVGKLGTNVARRRGSGFAGRKSLNPNGGQGRNRYVYGH